MAELLGRDDFAGLVGGTLEAGTADGHAVPLHVDHIQDLGGADGTRFSVFLDGPADVLLPQAIYPVRAADGKAFDLFLVPVGREDDRYRYEAAFNRDGG